MKINCIGQGVPENTEHYFILNITKDNITISETFNNNYTKELKASITIDQWNNIKTHVLYDIKKFVKDGNFKTNRLTSGENYINVLLGKQITILFWGIEQTNNITEINAAIKNWLGFEDAEKWYLYTMTNANLQRDYNRGWRGALKKILIEN